MWSTETLYRRHPAWKWTFRASSWGKLRFGTWLIPDLIFCPRTKKSVHLHESQNHQEEQGEMERCYFCLLSLRSMGHPSTHKSIKYRSSFLVGFHQLSGENVFQIHCGLFDCPGSCGNKCQGAFHIRYKAWANSSFSFYFPFSSSDRFCIFSSPSSILPLPPPSLYFRPISCITSIFAFFISRTSHLNSYLTIPSP